MIPEPADPQQKSLEDIYADRPETRSLALAGKIYDRKAKVVRADMMPKVALTANYLVSNPNVFNGVQKNWNGGLFTAGVMVNVPIFHGLENINRYKKAKAEVSLYQSQYEDARELIKLQVAQQRKVLGEAREKVELTLSNLDSVGRNVMRVPVDLSSAAEKAALQLESLAYEKGVEIETDIRKATVGYEAGVVPTNTVLGAQTAWLSAHSDYIDAGIELQMAAASLNKAEGNLNK